MSLKKFLYQLAINTLTLYLVVLFIPGVSLSEGLKPLLVSSFVLTLLNKLVKPFLKLLLLPFNLLTLGLFSWLVNVVTLYLLTLFVPALKIGAFVFTGFSSDGFVIPAMEVKTFYTYILTSLSLSLLTSLLRWLTD